MPEYFVQHLWSGLAMTVALYTSDYALTLACARLYQHGGREKIAFEGSIELNPCYQRDIDSLRRVSPRFLKTLLVLAMLLSAVWWLTRQTVPQAYALLLGLFVLIQCTVHMRHLRNLVTFQSAATDSLRGRIEYSRHFTLRLSTVDLLSYAVLYLALFAFTRSFFILGGVIGCLTLAGNHWKLARKQIPAAASAGQAAEETAVR